MDKSKITLKEILDKEGITAIEMYIIILEGQLETMPSKNFTTSTMEACLGLAKDILELYNIKNK